MLLFGLSGAGAQAQIDIWPANSTVEIGATKQFGAYVPLSPNTIVWSVNNIPNGDSTVGTINASGLYQAPAAAPSNNVVTVKAQSTAYPAVFKATSLTITRPYPWLWSVSPSPIVTGNYSVSFNGNNFAPDSQARANGVDIPTTYVSKTKLLASGNAATTGSIIFSVRQPGPGAVIGNGVSVTVNAAPPPPSITVVLAPASASVPLGSSKPFVATVSGTANTAVTWSVVGGAANGTITSGGIYTAPGLMPASPTVTVRAVSAANALAIGQATVTLLQPPVVVSVAPSTASVQLGNNKTFTATVTGTANTSVTWSVVGGAVNGTITPGGIYTAPAAMPPSPSLMVQAVSVADPSSLASASVTLTVPPDYSALLAAARLLEQSSFGPTSASIAEVQQLGVDGYLQKQFSLPASVIPVPADNSAGALQQWLLYNYTVAPDQLRQRVIYALSQIVVASINKQIYADAMLPWMNALSQHAFGNYKDLLRDVTRSSSMGKYLDLANSQKPGPVGGANENYARELMQLFTIGLWELNLDGTLATDANGFPVSIYGQQDVAQLALALTGWTYATAPGQVPRSLNNEYHGAPMETREGNHATGPKVFVGGSIPPNQTVADDLESVLDILINHPNTAPFIATRLIRSLVTSNPTPGYVQRVAQAFLDTGGNLQAVVTAILTDTEARTDVPTPNSGRLKEPILHISSFLRALDGHFNADEQLTYLYEYMRQSPLNPPSVFSWFSPLYHIPKNPLFGPEFQIYSPTEAALRGNFFHYILNTTGSDFTIDLSPYQPFGNDMAGLVEMANQNLLQGRMPAGMKQVLMDAAAPGYDAKTRIETVLYLTALSGQYAVQH